mgnify:FL=1
MAWDRTDLTSDAVCIDGIYIEDIFDEEVDGIGYFTQGSDGRSPMSREIEADEYRADGAAVNNMRYGAREIDVRYCLWAENSEKLRDAQNKLMQFFDGAVDADFVFNDQPDRFITGTIVADDNPKRQANLLEGKYTIYCKDPYFYSVSVFEADPIEVGDDLVFSVNYAGDVPTYPVLHADFAAIEDVDDYSADGDCGFISFCDIEDNVIQLGNVDAVDILDPTSKAIAYLNRSGVSVSGTNAMSASAGIIYSNGSKTGTVSGNHTFTDPYWNKGAGRTVQTIQATSYGVDTSKWWYGAGRYKTFSADCQNFEVHQTLRMFCSLNNFAKESGVYEVNITDASNKLIAGYRIYKDTKGTYGKLGLLCNVGGSTKEVKIMQIDLRNTNANFGKTRRQAVTSTRYWNAKTKKWQRKKIKGVKTKQVVDSYKYFQPNCNITMTKRGKQVTWKVGNMGTFTYKSSSIDDMYGHQVNIYFGRQKSMSAMTIAVPNFKCQSLVGQSYASQANVFLAGDSVDIDVASGSIILYRGGDEDGVDAPTMGALGNDWEDFVLSKGGNSINIQFSDWIDEGYEPAFKLRYNERYL